MTLALVAVLAAMSASAQTIINGMLPSNSNRLSVTGSTVAIQCLKVDGSGFESCGGGGTGTTVQRVTVDVDSFTVGNAAYMRFPSAQPITLPDGPVSVSILGSTGTASQPMIVAGTVAVTSLLSGFSVLGTTFTSSNPGIVAGTVAVTGLGGFSILGTTFSATNPGVVVGTVAVTILNTVSRMTVDVDSTTSGNPTFVKSAAPLRSSVDIDSFTYANAGFIRIALSTINVAGLGGGAVLVNINGSTFTWANPGVMAGSFAVLGTTFTGTNPGIVAGTIAVTCLSGCGSISGAQQVSVGVDSTTYANPSFVRVVLSTLNVAGLGGGPVLVSVDGTTFTWTNPGIVTGAFSVLGTTFTGTNPGIMAGTIAVTCLSGCGSAVGAQQISVGVDSFTYANAGYVRVVLSTLNVAGLGGGPILTTVAIDSFSSTNAGYVRFPSAQSVTLPTGNWGAQVDISTQPLNIGVVGGVNVSTGPYGVPEVPVRSDATNVLLQQILILLDSINNRLFAIQATMAPVPSPP